MFEYLAVGNPNVSADNLLYCHLMYLSLTELVRDKNHPQKPISVVTYTEKYMHSVIYIYFSIEFLAGELSV